MNVEHEWQKPMASLAVKGWILGPSVPLIATIPFGAWQVLWWWLKGGSCIEHSRDRADPSVASPGGATWNCLLAPNQEECQKAYRGGFAPLGNMQVRGLCSFPCLHSVSQWVHTATSVSLAGCFTAGSLQHPYYLCTWCQRAEGLPEEE